MAISGHQWQSVAISGQTDLGVEEGHQWQSVVISGNQWQSVARRTWALRRGARTVNTVRIAAFAGTT